MKLQPGEEISSLYQQMIEGWNNREADVMAGAFAEEGGLIGFDGSLVDGQAEIVAHLGPIFAHHPTAPYVYIVKSIQFLSPEVAILRAIAGMVPIGNSSLDPKLNTHHTMVAEKRQKKWQIVLFQNTPAQFHGRPELVEQMTEELAQILS
jgi:uncharacterized protein (TIGR02246 family)